MGKNAAFGRPGAQDRLRVWWYAQSQTTRANAVLFAVVAVVVVGLIFAALSRDGGHASTGLAALNQPGSGPTTPFVASTSTTSTTSTTVPSTTSSSSTTTSLPRPAGGTTTTTRRATPPPAAATTSSTVSLTTTPNPNIIFTAVPVATQPTSTSTLPAPTTTTKPVTTTTTAAPALGGPLGLPLLPTVG